MIRSFFAVAVVLAVLLVGFEPHAIPGSGSRSRSRSYPLDSRPPLASGASTGATLVYAQTDLRVINADTGASRSLLLPRPKGGSSDLSMVRIGSSLLLNRGNTAWLYRPGLLGPPVNLGPSLRVIPGPTVTEAWIWSDPCGATVACLNKSNGLGQGEVRMVDTSGNQVGSPVSLPDDATWFPTGDVVNAGLVLAVASIGPDAEEIWNPITNHVVRILPGADVLAARGNVAAWTTGEACLPHCTIQLTNVQTGIDQSVRLPTGITNTGEGAFSPDGLTLALPVGIGGPWPAMHPTSVVLVDLRTRQARLLPGAEQTLDPNYGPVEVSWSSDGWLFAAAIGSTTVLSWRSGDHGATVLPQARLPVFLPKAPSDFQNELPTLIAM